MKLYDGVMKHSAVCFSVAELSLCTFSSSTVSTCRWFSSRRALMLMIELTEARLLFWLLVARIKPLKKTKFSKITQLFHFWIAIQIRNEFTSSWLFAAAFLYCMRLEAVAMPTVVHFHRRVNPQLDRVREIYCVRWIPFPDYGADVWGAVLLMVAMIFYNRLPHDGCCNGYSNCQYPNRRKSHVVPENLFSMYSLLVWHFLCPLNGVELS